MAKPSLMNRLFAGIHRLLQSAKDQYAEGLQALEGTKTGWQDADRAFRYFRYAADRGHLKAMVKLGECYEHGIGVEADPVAAASCYSLAAEGGSAEGLGRLAGCQLKGVGVATDTQAAIRNYRAAAEQNDPDSQSCLGWCYEDGDGVEKCPTEAIRWYRRSAENGNADGLLGLGRCYFYGSGVEVDYAQAVHWLSLAAGQGKDAFDHFIRKQPNMAIAAAMGFLGACHEMGLGVEKDQERAEHWYGESAYRQHSDACRKYAEIIQAAMADTGNTELRERLVQRNQKFCGREKNASSKTFWTRITDWQRIRPLCDAKLFK